MESTPSKDDIELHKKLNEPKYNWAVVAKFLCQKFGVSDVPLINPWQGRVFCWDVTKETEMTVEVIDTNVKFNIRTQDAESQAVSLNFTPDTWEGSPFPKGGFVHPLTGKPLLNPFTGEQYVSDLGKSEPSS